MNLDYDKTTLERKGALDIALEFVNAADITIYDGREPKAVMISHDRYLQLMKEKQME